MIKRVTSPLAGVLVALLLLLTLASCGSDDTVADVDDAATLATAVPEAEPTPAPEPEPTAVPEPEPTAVPALAEDTDADHADDDHTDDEDHDDEDHSDEDHDDADDDDASATAPASVGSGVDLNLFFDGALVGEPTATSCTLSEGADASCLQITIAGYPADGDVGPFCPLTTSDTADTVGIWLDGEGIWDVDGEFILGLSEIYGDDNWKLYDDEGNVYVTDTPEAFDAAARPNVDPAYQNHCVEGQIAWLDGGQPVTSTVDIPAEPVAAASATRINGSVGITLNGVIIDGQAPVDAILGAYTIAAFDDCGGHINPVAGYHMHGATGCSEVGEAEAGDTPAFAYALDGYMIHSPLSDEQAAATELDECNGHVTELSGYHYHAAPAEENGVLTCFMGQTVSSTGDAATGDDAGPGAPADGAGPGDGPDLSEAAATLGVTEQELLAALGGPPPDFDAAAATLGVTVAELEAAMPAAPGR